MAHAIWLARHGSRLDFDDPEWAKHAPRPYDPPLSGEGRQQAEVMAARLARIPVAQIFSSPFLRCVETAAPIAETLGVSIRIERGLSEWLNPDWFPEAPELLPISQLAQRFPRVDVAFQSRGDVRFGESGQDALRRAGETARKLAAEFEGSLVLVGHGASVLGAMATLLGIPAEALSDLEYGELVGLVREGDRWRLYANRGRRTRQAEVK